MLKLSAFSKSFIKNTKGTWQGQGRIHNIDRSLYLVGFAEINEQATTAFSRIRVNKGWFFCSSAEAQPGDLIEDRVDGLKYLIMSVKNQVMHGETVYLDATLYLCDSTARIERWIEGERDVFGHVVDPSPQVIASDVYIMTNPQNYAVLEQNDRQIAQDKVRIYVQAKYGVRPADRIVASSGDTYRVLRVDKVSLMNIWICYVDVDER